MHVLVKALELQEKESLYFDERVNASVDHAYQIKYNEKVKGLIHRAHFRYPQASVEDIYYSKRELDKDQIMTLITNSYIDSYKNVLIVRFTGSRNYILVVYLGGEACNSELKVKYIRLPDLLFELELSRIQGILSNKIYWKY